MRLTRLFFILLLSMPASAQRVADTRDFWYEGRRYLVCNLRGGGVISLDMATAKPVEPARALHLRDSAVKAGGAISAAYNFKDGTYCAWNNCGQPPVAWQPRKRISLEKKPADGVLYAGTIPGFDKLLKQDAQRVRDWEKLDKKRSVKIYYDEPVLRYDTLHRRIFLVTHAGLAWVAEDSIGQGAKIVLGEVPGLRLVRVVSPLYHRFLFLQFVQDAVGEKDTKELCRVFDTHTMRLLRLPDTETMTGLRFAFCPTGDYVLAVPEWPAPGMVNFQRSPVFINLRNWKKECTLQLGGMQKDMRFYLDRQLLYAMSHEHDRLWVYDLSQNEKVIFRQEEKR